MSLKVWLPLTGTLENKGISNYTPTIASGNSWASAGKIGAGAITLTKQQTILPTSSCMTGAKQMSYCYWVKVNTAWETQWLDSIRWISTNGSTTHISRQEFYTNCTLIGTWYQGGSIAGISFTPGEWIHIAVTFNYNTGEVKFYKNGIRVGSATNLDTSHYCRGDFYIGDTGVDICENDVRIYDHCLSAAEVHEISQGLVLHYKLDRVPNGKITNAFNMSSWNTDTTRGGFSSWGASGHKGTYGTNTNRDYIYYPHRTYSYWVANGSDSTPLTYLFYQSPAFEGGYRSLQCILKEENGEPITEDIIRPSWNANVAGEGHAPAAKWSWVLSLGKGFYLCKVNGLYQDGSNDLVGLSVTRGHKVYISEIWLENNKEICSEVLFSNNIIQDNSGYGYNGIITGTPTLTAETKRYSASTYFNGSSYILTPAGSFAWNDLTKLTLSAWIKPTASVSSWTGSIGIAADTGNTARGFSITDYANTFRVTYGNGSYATQTSGKTLTVNEWHHCAATLDGTTCNMYFDGALVKTVTIDWGSATLNTNARFQVGIDIPGTDEKFTGNYSDVRMYCTALSAADIKQLYEMGAKIDNKGNLHTYEFNEFNSNKLKKTGIFYNYATEPYIQLADGSCWKLLLFHYVDNGTNLFTSTTAQYNDGFGLYSRLRDIDNFKYNNKYEFYVIQDGATHRWSQTNAPLTTTSVTGFTSISGSPNSGLCKCNGNTLLARTSTTSNWWNAAGCWTLYQGGIPGFGGSVVCKQYVALYVRIDKITYHNASNAHYANNLIEL